MATLYVIPDTNVFLHFRRPDLLDWPAIAGTDHVCVLLVSPVLRELDQHKNSGRDPVLRQRAQDISEWIRTHLEPAGDEHGVEIHVREPRAWPPDLDPSVMDDRLIAAALEQREAAREVAILSDDTLVLAKCIAAGLRSLRPRAQDRRSQDADPRAVRIKKLEQELQAERSKRPALRIEWEEGGAPLLVRLAPPNLSDMLNDADLGAQHPKVPMPEAVDRRQWVHLVQKWGFQPSPSQISEYNQMLTEFHRAYDLWRKEETATRTLRANSFTLMPVVTNTGTTPATDVRVVLELPSGARVLASSGDAGVLTSPPAPPGRFGSRQPHKPAVPRWPSFAYDQFVLERPPGLDDPSWPTASVARDSVTFVLSKVQQGDRVKLRPFKVYSEDTDRSAFALKGTVRCDELPAPSPLKLVVKLRS